MRMCPMLFMAALICSPFLIWGCADDLVKDSLATPQDQVADEEVDMDPFEGFNRTVFAINQTIDGIVIRPVTLFYREFMPVPLQDCTHNFFNNLSLPGTIINDLFQTHWEEAATNLDRFLTNTTAGFLGIADIYGGQVHDEDFGQTLGVHGMEDGPYVMLPLLGPSNFRDAIGTAVDAFFDPFNYFLVGKAVRPIAYGRYVGQTIDSRNHNLELLDDLNKDSLDFYAKLRSVYSQYREHQIHDQKDTSVFSAGK